MAGGGGSIEGGEPEFQVAPMIDVLLVLLIFFMTITTTQVLKVDKQVNLPVASNAQKKDNSRNEVIVNVRWYADLKRPEFVVDGMSYAKAEQLKQPLALAMQAGSTKVTRSVDPTFRAVIRGDRDVPAVHVARAMNMCAEAGITDIAFSSVNKD